MCPPEVFMVVRRGGGNWKDLVGSSWVVTARAKGLMLVSDSGLDLTGVD